MKAISRFRKNFSKAVPLKARFVMVFTIVAVGAVGFFIVNGYVGDKREVADIGMVELNVDTQQSQEVTKDKGTTEDNALNRKLNELREKEKQEIKENSEQSYIEPPDLSQPILVSEQSNTEGQVVKSETNPDVLDLSALFETNQPTKDSGDQASEDERVEAAKKNLGYNQPNPEKNAFNRQSYLNSINSFLEKGSEQDVLQKIQSSSLTSGIKISTYQQSGQQPNEATTGHENNTETTNQDIMSPEYVSSRRQQLTARMQELRDVATSGIYGSEAAKESTAPNQQANGSKNFTENDTYTSNYQVGAGDVVYAINDIEVVSNESNQVRATIIQNGDMYGAVLLGKFTQVNDVVALEFNNYMVDGKSYTINAIAIDAETWKTGLADDVNHHYFTRYLGIVASALASGYADTLQNSSTNTSNGNVTESSERIESSKERFHYAIGNVGRYLAPKMLENVDKPSTVTVNRYKDVGIMFLTDFRVPARI